MRKKMPGSPELLTVSEVMAYLRVSRATVIRYARKGVIPGKKIGSIWRFSRNEIEAAAK